MIRLGQQEQPERGEADHHREHPVLGLGGDAVARVELQRPVMGEDQTADVARDERRDLRVPDAVAEMTE